MCDMGHDHGREGFGYLVDTPEIRALIAEVQRVTGAIRSDEERVTALRPAFAALLAADDWLPEECARPDEKSRMGGGIAQYALYRAEDGSLCLFSLVVPAGAATPVHDHLAWGLVGIYRGRQDETVYRRLDDGSDPAQARLEVSQAADARHRASSTRCCRPPTTFTTSRPCPTRRRSQSTCSPTTRRASGGTGSTPRRARSRRSGPATRTRRVPPTKRQPGEPAAHLARFCNRS